MRVQAAEIRDSGALLGAALGEITELVGDVQKAVARRIFGLFGPAAVPARLLHDAISTTAFGCSRAGVQVLPTVAGAVVAKVGPSDTTSVYDSRRGHIVLSFINGLWGDRLAEQRTTLAPVMSIRTHDGRLRRVPADVVDDLGDDPSGKLVVFIHGLCENDRFWWFGAEKNWGDRSTTYGSLLREDDGWTPLYVHFNSGLHISENGRILADFIESLVHVWPVPVTEIALVGHSMGGLVAHSAAHQAISQDLDWTTPLRHIVGLGAP